MKWEKFIQGMFVGGIRVEIRSLRTQDPLGSWRRYRACSTDASNNKITKKPAFARLLKDKSGKAGVVIQPRGAGFVKVGKNAAVQQMIIAPMGAISKKQRQKLLKQASCCAYEQDGCLWVETLE